MVVSESQPLPDEQSEPTEFERFVDLTKKLVKVPKDEVKELRKKVQKP